MCERMMQKLLEVLQASEDEAGWEGGHELVARVVCADHPLAQRQGF